MGGTVDSETPGRRAASHSVGFRADASLGDTGLGHAPLREVPVGAGEDVERKKRELIDDAAQLCESERQAAILRGYFATAAAEDVVAYSAEELLGIVRRHCEVAATRIVGTENIHVEVRGGRRGSVAIVTDDMPFLVDSVTQELTRLGVFVESFVHPQFVVRRSVTGELLDVLDRVVVEDAPPGTVVESWMRIDVSHLEIEPDGLVAALRRVLRDVRSAVEDWERMRATALRIASQLRTHPPVADDDAHEAADFLEWLAADHFTFLGYREYRIVSVEGTDALAAVPGTGLGILRADQHGPRKLAEFPPEVRGRIREPRLLVVTKANSRSTVHRPDYLDYIGVKVFDAAGNVIGERRFLGLFTSSVYAERVLTIPMVRRKVQEVLDRSGFPPRSHDGKALREIIEDHPRDDLLQISASDLYTVAMGVLHLRERRQLRLFLRREEYGRFYSCLVYLPRDRYSTAVRLEFRRLLLEALGGTSIDDALRVTDSVLARVHFVVRVPPGSRPAVDRDELERRLAAALRTWDDDFADAMTARFDDETAASLLYRYNGAFPEAYKEDFSADTAVDDVRAIERLQGPRDIDVKVYEPSTAGGDVFRVKICRVGPPISLATLIPLLTGLGVEVTDERPYGIERRDAEHAWIYDFGLRRGFAVPQDEKSRRYAGAAEAIVAMWQGRAEIDGFHALTLRAGLSWRQVTVLRAYAKYLRQTGIVFSQEYIEAALSRNSDVAALLVALFESRFDPGRAPDVTVEQGIEERLDRALDAVSSLDDDRILRCFRSAIQATVRTNFWQTEPPLSRDYVSFKLLARNIDFLPQPRPLYEAYVYSPRMEGIHLRFGPVARGGIRYSDRREDFRAEILGLAKTQTVKNAVIVPVGAKGGFVVTRPLPDDPDAAAAEVVACYRTLIRGLLDLTDNLDPATGTVIPPDRTVRRDGDDTYLVVAADKGTATFSDIANEIAAEYHYWLADAFASGGSAGYDHKAMGITARGAWESVKRHFRELGVDIHRNTITCVGIGDMSGDVFGNGMLLSSNLKLVAAFDHRHIFLDPDPDPAVSYAERRRLFTLPRSSWADYDASRISPGGGVWPRSAKRIPVSTEAAAVLGIAPGDYVPTEVIRAILRAPVDLLWNGGIGTYVKASTESHADVGDRANDAVRIDAAELRCRVVAEGGNLGFTQPARVEYALRGGRINTDAIDNSAGVDTSDHEVNVKILLNVAQRAGRLDAGERHALLGTLSDEVAALVLRDNYEQNLALSCLEAESAQHLHVHAAFIDALERAGILDRRLEHLPDPKSIAARAAAGRGLVRPELAILLAYAKIALTHELVRSSVPDEPFAHEVLREYFPTALRQRFAADMLRHPLQRDIMATCLANRVVNMSGVDFVYRLMEETGATGAECVRAHVAARRIFSIDDLWRRIEELDNDVPAQQQIRLLLSVRQSMARIAHWIVRHRRPLDNVGGIVDPLRPAGELVGRLADVLRGEEAAAVERVVAEYCASRVPDALARSVALLDHAVSALAVVDVAARLDGSISVTEAAEQYFLVAERLRLTALRRAIAALPHDDRWQALARSGVQEELLAVQADLAGAVLRGRGWSAEREQQVATIIQDAVTTPSLAAITVALGALRALREDG